jgi:pyridoxine 4-dehydrogenase
MANACIILIALALLLATHTQSLLLGDNNYRVLNGGVKISKLGIGTWAWGDKRYWRYSSEQDLSLQETFNYCLQRGGVNFFDTAEVYGGGKSELLLGMYHNNRQLY